MTIEDIIKEAFSQGWNASHECATDFDYEYSLRKCLSEFDSKVKKLNIPAVSRQSEQLFCDCEIKGSSFELDTGEICCCKCEKKREQNNCY